MTRWLSFAVFFAIATCHNQIDALVTPSARNVYCRGHTVPLLEYTRESEQFLHQRRHNQRATALQSATEAAANGANGDISTEEVDDDDDDELPHDDFEPRTMKVFESFAFFARFTVQSIIEKRAMKSQDGSNRRRLRQRLKQLIFRRKNEQNDVIGTIKATKKQPDEKTGIRGSLSGLNESRKNLTRLVGYDSSLLLPAFSYLLLGALMSSIVPHYYSACISCVAAGEPNRAKLIWAIGGLGLSHVAEALFTGFRGALFWIAGTLPCICRKY